MLDFVKGVSIDNWISSAAFVVAAVSLIFAIKAFCRTSQKLYISIDEFTVWQEDKASTKEFVFNLLIRNPHNIPLTIYDIQLKNNGNLYKQDERTEPNISLSPNGVEKYCVVFYVDKSANESRSLFVVRTSAKNFKYRLSHSFHGDKRNDDSDASHTNSK